MSDLFERVQCHIPIRTNFSKVYRLTLDAGQQASDNSLSHKARELQADFFYAALIATRDYLARP